MALELVLPNSLKSLAKEPIKLNEAIRELLNYFLIRRSPDHTLALQRNRCLCFAENGY